MGQLQYSKKSFGTKYFSKLLLIYNADIYVEKF